ncbi:MAG TPA: hypothetical protein VFM99_04805 [Chitinophagales bacterium]|nr:hypothetical protein [Chitinophagales bacterium]
MKKSFLITFLFILSTFVITQTSCNKTADANGGNTKLSRDNAQKAFTTNDQWNNYWYQGLAEISSYTLQQGRYSHVHPGTVINVFVTEDFSKSKHVKLDDPANAGADKLPILKMNQEFKFNTGIYSYSSMLSVFQPTDIINYPHAIKVTTSVQDWCGMAFMQLNAKGKKNEIQQLSYFESEGDREFSYDQIVLEDELWTQIKIAPEKLPVGNMDIMPGSIYLRYSHNEIKPYAAQLSLQDVNDTRVYIIQISELKKSLTITFEKEFPYTILGWEESYPGFDGSLLKTTATLNKTIMSDYWNKHNLEDRVLRKDLGLPEDYQ